MQREKKGIGIVITILFFSLLTRATKIVPTLLKARAGSGGGETVLGALGEMTELGGFRAAAGPLGFCGIGRKEKAVCGREGFGSGDGDELTASEEAVIPETSSLVFGLALNVAGSTPGGTFPAPLGGRTSASVVAEEGEWLVLTVAEASVSLGASDCSTGIVPSRRTSFVVSGFTAEP